MYKQLISILNEMGYCIFEKDEDFDIRDYILDSLQFMEFIVRIEDVIEQELSDDFLNYELLLSATAFAKKIECYLEESSNQQLIPPTVS